MAKVGADPPGERKAPRLSSQIARDVGMLILSGRCKPGDLLEGEVAASERLRVSRTTYREAMRILVAKGFLEIRQRVGTRVSSSDRWHWLDADVLTWMLEVDRGPGTMATIFELRRAVEPDAAALAAQRRTDAQLGEMRQALDRIERLAFSHPRGNPPQEQFRSVLFESAGNFYFAALGQTINKSLLKLAAKAMRLLAMDPGSAAQYQRLFTALASADGRAAQKAMLKLIEHEWSYCGV